MAEAAAMPSLAEAMRWVGAELRDLDGAAVGEVAGLYVDRGSGDPAWLIARLGKRRRAPAGRGAAARLRRGRVRRLGRSRRGGAPHGAGRRPDHGRCGASTS